MEKGREKPVCTKRSYDRIEEVDRLSNLPDCLIFQILLHLPTKYVVKTSVLSKRWGDLWRYVPGLDLEYKGFRQNKASESFVDKFLGVNKFCLQKFKFKFDVDWVDDECTIRWINTVVKLKVQHLDVSSSMDMVWFHTISPTVYTCESLVSLNLLNVSLPDLEYVSLPSLKVIILDKVDFANDLAFEMLISSCPLLETLTLWMRPCVNVHVLRVCSKSLLSFKVSSGTFSNLNDNDPVISIDAPRLEYLNIDVHEFPNFIINNSSNSLVKLEMEIDIQSPSRFVPEDDLLKRNMMIGNFRMEISSVKVMNISGYTLKVIFGYSIYEKLPVFCNLSKMSIILRDMYWEAFVTLLESCPNLKSLSMIFYGDIGIKHGGSESRQSLKSLEYVMIEQPQDCDEEPEMKVVNYILENSPVLKKLTFYVETSKRKLDLVILKKLLSFPRLSTSCEIVVLDPFSPQR